MGIYLGLEQPDLHLLFCALFFIYMIDQSLYALHHKVELLVQNCQFIVGVIACGYIQVAHGSCLHLGGQALDGGCHSPCAEHGEEQGEDEQ